VSDGEVRFVWLYVVLNIGMRVEGQKPYQMEMDLFYKVLDYFSGLWCSSSKLSAFLLPLPGNYIPAPTTILCCDTTAYVA
jgi:hypothetical protein